MALPKLGINIDHTATVREARGEKFPDPVELAQLAVQNGADGITAHLREDRRHIQDADIYELKEKLKVPLNLEMAASSEIISIATRVKPTWCCLVPEKRQELTTEGGLDLISRKENLKSAIDALKQAGINVSLFIDPDFEMVLQAQTLGCDAVELHTGPYARAFKAHANNADHCSGVGLAVKNSLDHELRKLIKAGEAGLQQKILVNAGHGLDYDNLAFLNEKFNFNEFNIGFSVVARALFVGMGSAVKEMKNLIKESVCVES